MKYKIENFQLENVNEKDILRKFAIPNRAFKHKKPQPGQTIYEYTYKQPKVTITQDQVFANGICIGKIKKGSVKRVQNLINNPDYSYSMAELTGGSYITNNLDGEGNLKTYKGKSRVFAKLHIYIKDK